MASAVYADQRRIAGRVVLTDDQVVALLAMLLAAPATRAAPARVAAALGEHPTMVRGAAASAARLLNVEGYPVLRLDADGATVVVDEALLREQFELRP